MESEEITEIEKEKETPQATTSSQIVTAESVQAEEVPTIPLGSLQTISNLQPEITVHSVEATEQVSTPEPLVAPPAEYRRSTAEWTQIWKDGIRPAYLSLAVAPALLGSVLAWSQSVSTRTPLGQFHILPFLVAIVAVLLLQAGANLVNDYYDYTRGVDTANTLGPGGLIQQGIVKPTRVLIIGLALLGVGALLGLTTVLAAGPLILLFGLLGLLGAYFFSAGPRSLSSLALGELVGFVVFGPLITAGAYVTQTGHLSPSAFLYGVPLGLLAAAIIHANNMRDAEDDSQAGKHTLATLLGLQWNRAWFFVLLLGAYGLIAALALPSGGPHWLLITFWTLPTLVIVVTGMLRTDMPVGLHLVMRETLKLQAFFGLLFVVALIITAIVKVLPHLPAHILPI
ncbi:1,4-dihydroxy-2-naphthoate octaprenyltransferase [Ktedonosporobacter rubrisoli]|nr:1,4-dihydroxy-2-naphthoate octaprenyltransferase [Ktedonosporobacter rubrisoli]